MTRPRDPDASLVRALLRSASADAPAAGAVARARARLGVEAGPSVLPFRLAGALFFAAALVAKEGIPKVAAIEVPASVVVTAHSPSECRPGIEIPLCPFGPSSAPAGYAALSDALMSGSSSGTGSPRGSSGG